MQKNLLHYSLIFMISLLCGRQATAQLYIGGDFSRSFISYQGDYNEFYNEDYNVYGPVVGISVNGIGMEGFYQMSGTTDNESGQETEFRVYGAEFIMALPTTDMVDFVASLGFVKYEFEYTPSGGERVKDDCEGIRFGLGFQINLSKHIALRTMYHYSSINSNIDKFEDINEITTGLRIYF